MIHVQQPHIQISGNGHCCICSGMCGHIGGPYYCDRHSPDTSKVHDALILDPLLVPIGFYRACRASVTAVLGLGAPAELPCGLLDGHAGRHRYQIEWSEPDKPPADPIEPAHPNTGEDR